MSMGSGRLLAWGTRCLAASILAPKARISGLFRKASLTRSASFRSWAKADPASSSEPSKARQSFNKLFNVHIKFHRLRLSSPSDLDSYRPGTRHGKIHLGHVALILQTSSRFVVHGGHPGHGGHHVINDHRGIRNVLAGHILDRNRPVSYTHLTLPTNSEV